jgi:hypothetical protein
MRTTVEQGRPHMVRKQLIICRTIWIADTRVYPRQCAEASILPQAELNTIFVWAGMDSCTYRSHGSAFKLIGVQ